MNREELIQRALPGQSEIHSINKQAFQIWEASQEIQNKWGWLEDYQAFKVAEITAAKLLDLKQDNGLPVVGILKDGEKQQGKSLAQFILDEMGVFFHKEGDPDRTWEDAFIEQAHKMMME